jgi:hypothetical protein
MTLSLPDVTLCAVTNINHELTVRAMKECLKHCSFADVVLISDRAVDAPFRVEIIPPFPDGAFYAPFVCHELGKYTPSAFNLLVQYDSHIVEPRAWSDAFLNYDYIGAKWPWHAENRRVGNSGFCLRSKKLLDVMAKIPLPPVGSFVDDEFIAHTIRGQLEKDHGIKIAPDAVADLFAYERHTPAQPTFGFHGMFNFWRHTDDAEMETIVDLMDELYVPSRAYVEVLFHYYTTRKFPVFCAWYRRLRNHYGLEKLRPHLLSFTDTPAVMDDLIRVGERVNIIYPA